MGVSRSVFVPRQQNNWSLTKAASSGTSVYDITDWIDSHPGGSVILRAAGGALEPYWSVFSFHTKPDIVEMLDEYRIGEVCLLRYSFISAS